MPVDDLMKTISETFKVSTSAGAVFGESRTIGKRTIIPVAKVRLGFGAGGCGGTGEEGCKGEGGGGGGGGVAMPVAVVEVGDQETRVIPVVDVTKIVLSSLCFAGMVTWMITKIFARKRS